MTGVEHDEGSVEKLDAIHVGMGAALELRLFKNNFTPTRAHVLADFTQANFSGYATVAPVYGPAALDANNNAKATAGTYTWTHNGGGVANTIYGVYEVDTGSGKVVNSWKFNAPVSMAANGDNVVFTPSHYQGQIVPPL